MLLVHPPNSSSAATLGAAANPPDAPGTIGVSAKELVPQPKSFVFARPGLFGVGLASGSGAAHAFPPHTSAPDSPPKDPSEFDVVVALVDAAAAAGSDCFCWFEERLKTELTEGAGAGLLAAGAAG
jgi:hypothetical protein